MIAWGERGRIGAQHVMTRARDVGQRMYPGDLAAFESFLASQPAPEPMTAGRTWNQSLVLAPAAALSGETRGISRETRTPDYFLERVSIR